MKSVKILMMVVAAAVLTTTPAQADSVVLKVRVPFDFVVADRHLPSGEYRFVREQNPNLVRVYSKGNEQLALATWVPLAKGTEDGGKLVFQKHGDQRFLRMIRPSDGSGAYLPKTRSEEEAEEGVVGMP